MEEIFLKYHCDIYARASAQATKESEEGKGKRVFYSLQEYEAWRESLRGNASGWAIEKVCVFTLFQYVTN